MKAFEKYQVVVVTLKIRGGNSYEVIAETGAHAGSYSSWEFRPGINVGRKLV